MRSSRRSQAKAAMTPTSRPPRPPAASSKRGLRDLAWEALAGWEMVPGFARAEEAVAREVLNRLSWSARWDMTGWAAAMSALATRGEEALAASALAWAKAADTWDRRAFRDRVALAREAWAPAWRWSK